MKNTIENRASQIHDALFATPGANPNRAGRKPYAHWRRTFRPDSQRDRRAMAKMIREAQVNTDGSALFCFLPAGDDGRRCPLGVEIYTPYGWNMLRQCGEAFARGETVWMESDAE